MTDSIQKKFRPIVLIEMFIFKSEIPPRIEHVKVKLWPLNQLPFAFSLILGMSLNESIDFTGPLCFIPALV